jgi:hypothetical protein
MIVMDMDQFMAIKIVIDMDQILAVKIVTVMVVVIVMVKNCIGSMKIITAIVHDM